jgi:hypothetical protein
MYRVDMKNLLRVEVLPNPLEPDYRPTPLVRFGCQNRRGNTPRRSTDNHLERITRPRQQLSQRQQHADLVRGA